MSASTEDLAKIINLINKEIRNLQSEISQLEQFEKNGFQSYTVNPYEKHERLLEYRGLLNRVERLKGGEELAKRTTNHNCSDYREHTATDCTTRADKNDFRDQTSPKENERLQPRQTVEA